MNKQLKQNLLRNTPTILRFAPYILLGCVFLMIATLLFYDYRSERSETNTAIYLTKEKGDSIIHSFEASLLSSRLWNLENSNNILMELANHEEIYFLAVIDTMGRIISSSDQTLLGQIIKTSDQHTNSLPHLNGEIKEINLNREGVNEKISLFLVNKQLFVLKPFSMKVHRQPLGNNLFSKERLRNFSVHKSFEQYLLENDLLLLNENRNRNRHRHPKPNDPNRLDFIQKRLNQIFKGNIYSMLVAFDINKIVEAKEIDDAKDNIYTTFFISLTVLGIFSFFILVAYQRSYTHIQNGKAYILSLMDALPLGIITLDHKNNILAINQNAQKLIQCTEENNLGKHISEIIPDLYHDNLKNIRNLIINLHKQKGNTGQIEINSFPISDKKESGYGIILQDLREIQILQEKLDRQERLASIGSLAAGIAHEIRNPLGAVKGLARFFAESSEKGSEEERLAKVMTEEVMRVDKVVSDLLELSKPNNLNIEQVDLSDLFEKVKCSISLQTKQKITFSEQLISDKAFLDKDRMIQVLQNIYLNSIQSFLEKGGTIQTKVRFIDMINQNQDMKFSEENFNNMTFPNIDKEYPKHENSRHYNKMLEIIISDNGKGIKQEHLKNIFTPYYTNKAKGTGLGLVMVQKIIQAHNGTICVESEENTGTKVIIKIPQ